MENLPNGTDIPCRLKHHLNELRSAASNAFEHKSTKCYLNLSSDIHRAVANDIMKIAKSKSNNLFSHIF